MKSHARFLLPFAALSLFAAGCSSSPTPSASESTPKPVVEQKPSGKMIAADPCLLTKEEATKILERQAKDPVRKDESGATPNSSCFYGVEPQGTSLAGLAKNITVMTYQSVTGFDAVEFYNNVKNGDPSLPRTALAGIGDDAFWDGRMVIFLKGQTMVMISVGSLSEATKQEKMVEIAKLMAERMP